MQAQHKNRFVHYMEKVLSVIKHVKTGLQNLILESCFTMVKVKSNQLETLRIGSIIMKGRVNIQKISISSVDNHWLY